MTVDVAPTRGGVHAAGTQHTLRQVLDARRAQGQPLTLEESIAIVVPLCLDVQARHNRGETLYLHPGCVLIGGDGITRFEPRLATAPTTHQDLACLAPELVASRTPGNSRASVFAIGAILYEMVTCELVGPGMRRPKQIDPTLPSGLETLLAKALVANPAARPDDLGALASAMHHVAPMKSIPPPEVSAARLDQGEDFVVDVKLSMIPPNERPSNPGAQRNSNPPQIGLPPGVSAPGTHQHMTDPYRAIDARPNQPKAIDATTQLAELKVRLESDPRPRYVVNKEMMDHGPFSAVELLQQIASNQFTEDHTLRDELSGQSKLIKEWDEFAPFAEHAKLHRQVIAEKKEVVRLEKAERTSGALKFIVGGVVLAAVAAAAVVFIVKARGSRNEDTDIVDDPNALALDFDGGLGGRKRAGGGRGGGGGGRGGGGFAYGMSYEAAIAANNQDISIGGNNGGPDLTNAQLSAPMRNAAFISGCGAPDDMKVTVKVAIKNGRAVGVSVYTNPANASVSSCVDKHVRAIGWPSSGKMDSFTTTY
jgi:hypothetical protein